MASIQQPVEEGKGVRLGEGVIGCGELPGL